MSRKKTTKAFNKKLAKFLHTIGDNLYALRISRKENLKTVAEAVKMSPITISKVEKGRCPHCKFGTLIRLCKYYEANLLDVVSEGKFIVQNKAKSG